MRAKPYYAPGGLSAAYFDVVTAADPGVAGDVEVYAALAPAGGSVLELGCGTGRIAQALAERGLSVVGVDIAPAMLALAEARRGGLPAEIAARIAFRRGDMAALDLKQAFDLVACPFFTLAHTPAGQAWRGAFASAARNLAPGGLAAFHLPRLETMRSLPPVTAKTPVMSLPLGGGGRLTIRVCERRFREDIGRLDQVLDYAVSDSAGRVMQHSLERLTYWMADPLPYAAAAGLRLDREPIALGAAGDIWIFGRD